MYSIVKSDADMLLEVVASFTLPFECRDPAPILRILLYVNVSEAARGESLLRL